jgi:ankyrin repeat protein
MAEDFFELVKDGSSEEVQKAVNAGANINARDKYGYTPLMDASYGNENPEVIEVLLESGAGINARDKDEGTHVKYAEEQNKNNTISKEEKDNISSEETIDEENILEKIRVVAKKYDSDLQSISKVINVKKYIKIIDITGYTKTYDSKSFVVDVFINTEKNLYKDVLEMSYEIYSLIYENRKNHNINHVSLIYQNNGGKNTAQVTLGINVIKNIFSKKINSVNEFYEIINSNKNLNAEYLEDICVANEYGYISE